MNISGYSKHIFWSYKKDASLPEEVVIRHVIAYGRLSDLVLLSRQFPAPTIQGVISKWKEKERYKKRINLMQKVILDK
jgi:hypothetical protein